MCSKKNVKFAAMIPARLDSKRLPGKGLLPLGPLPIIGHVLNRTNRIKHLNNIFLTTTDRSIDDPLVEYTKNDLGIKVFRGDLNDVANRIIKCAIEYDIDFVVRINGDCPFIDPGLITEGIEICLAGGYEFVTNIPNRTFPYGISVEIFKNTLLQNLLHHKGNAEDREHVTSILYKNLHLIHHYSIEGSRPDLAKARLVVDTKEDLEVCRQLCKALGPNFLETGYETVAEEYLRIILK